MVNIPDMTSGYGIPAQWAETITGVDGALITGHFPEVIGVDMLVEASQVLSKFHVVGLNGSGRIVPASASFKPVGIIPAALTTDASTAYKGATIWRSGVFNPDMLVWPAYFATDALKFTAFEGSPAPTQIIIRRPGAGLL